MKRMLFGVIVTLIAAGAVCAYPVAINSYNVQTVGLGDTIDKVFAVFGPPQAIQILGNDSGSGYVQFLYFKKEDSLSINLSDLPENKVVQIEFSGNSWTANTPVKVGDSLDKITSRLGSPDKTEDLSTQKLWMLEQAGNDAVMRHIIERSSGDTAYWYQHHGLYMEYDKRERLVKSVRIYDPLAKLAVNVNKI